MNAHSHCRSKLSEWPGNACTGEVLIKPQRQLVVRHLSKCAGHQEHTRASKRAAFEQGSHADQPMNGYQPIHAQTTRSDLDSPREPNNQPQHIRRGTTVFAYSPMVLSEQPCKVWYINLPLRGWLVHLIWVSCDCVHWCKYEPLNEVCVSKREYAWVRFNIFRANFAFLSPAFRY